MPHLYIKHPFWVELSSRSLKNYYLTKGLEEKIIWTVFKQTEYLIFRRIVRNLNFRHIEYSFLNNFHF